MQVPTPSTMTRREPPQSFAEDQEVIGRKPPTVWAPADRSHDTPSNPLQFHGDPIEYAMTYYEQQNSSAQLARGSFERHDGHRSSAPAENLVDLGHSTSRATFTPQTFSSSTPDWPQPRQQSIRRVQSPPTPSVHELFAKSSTTRLADHRRNRALPFPSITQRRYPPNAASALALPRAWSFAHDARLCALDTEVNLLSTPQMAAILRREFAELRGVMITPMMLEKRLLILDQDPSFAGWALALHPRGRF